jgi:tetratricopeptide (TPR) repeat protein
MVNMADRADRLKEKGTQLVRQGQLTEAAKLFSKALSFSKRDTDALMALGTISGMQGNYAAAERYFGKAIHIDPGLATAHYNLGIAQKYQGKLEDAAGSYRQAIACTPDIPDYYNNLGNVYMELQQLDEAIDCFTQALQLQPDSADCYYNLGKALRSRGLRQDAVDAFNNALTCRPGFAAALKELARVHLSLGDADSAEKYYTQASDADPADNGAVAGLANVFVSKHEYQRAFAILEPRIGERCPDASIATAFADIARHAARREKEAVELLERALQGPKQPGRDDCAQILFRLGHFHDRMQQYDTAFEHFRRGNELRGSATDHDEGDLSVELIRDSFSRAFIHAAPRSDQPTDQAVFIIGMPRSGTTLVEQVIASHPRAHGAGELDTLPALLASIPGLVGAGNLLPDGLKLLDRAHVTTLAGQYLTHLKSLAPGAARITDKLPANFINLGFISLLFPGARVIHCRRMPLDTCLSCYFQDFSGHHPYATDLQALGRYYRRYQRLMEHWEEVLEINLLEVDYEALVNDFETVCRTIIGFCGLEWDPACLAFHRHDRVVATASAGQVVKPLYSSAVGRWKHYEKHLASLIAALGPE